MAEERDSRTRSHPSFRAVAMLIAAIPVLIAGCGEGAAVNGAGLADDAATSTAVSTTDAPTTLDSTKPTTTPSPTTTLSSLTPETEADCEVLSTADVEAVIGEPVTFELLNDPDTRCFYRSDGWDVTVVKHPEPPPPVDPADGSGESDPAVPAPNQVSIRQDRSGLFNASAYVIAGGDGWIVSVYNKHMGADTYPPMQGEPLQIPATESAVRGILTRITQILD